MYPTIAQEALELNNTLGHHVKILSKKGEDRHYPIKGILSQSGRSDKTNPNATIGVGIYDNGQPMTAFGAEEQYSQMIKDFTPHPGDLLYANSFGNPELRKMWKELFLDEHPSLNPEDISEMVITNGGSDALRLCDTFINPGDQVIAPYESWDNIGLVFEVEMGAPILRYPLFDKNGGINIEGLRNQLESPGNKKIIYLNFPNNPTGATLNNSEYNAILQAIEDAANSGKDVIAINDGAYRGFDYTEIGPKESLFAPLSKLHENVLAIEALSASKRYNYWGGRVGGILIGNEGMNEKQYKALTSKLAGGVRGTNSNISKTNQALLYKIMNSPECLDQLEKNKAILKERYLVVNQILSDKRGDIGAAGLEACRSGGGYFVSLRTKNNDVNSTGYVDADHVGEILRAPEPYTTGVISLGDLLRISFSSVPKNKLPVLFQNVCNACNDYKSGVRVGNIC